MCIILKMKNVLITIGMKNMIYESITKLFFGNSIDKNLIHGW